MSDEHGPDAKLLCLPAGDARYDKMRDLDDLPTHLRDEIRHFFDVYKALEPGKSTEIRGWQGRKAAEAALHDARSRRAP